MITTKLLKNKRHWERVSFFKELVIMEKKSGKKVEANGINISVGGIGFYSKNIFQKGTPISIQICLNNELQAGAVWINATAMWSKIEQDGVITGAEFDTIIKPTNHPILYKMIYERNF